MTEGDIEKCSARLKKLTAGQRRHLADRLTDYTGREPAQVTSRTGRLTACVRVQSQAQTAPEDLKRFAGELLPDYMVPQQVLIVSDFPRASGGKIDRKALSDHAWDIIGPQVEAQTGFAGPRNAVEETLAGIWAEVLGVDQVSINDDFYEIGGDSLLSIRILARANKAGLRISPEDFFAYPTIAGQAGLVETAEARPEQSGPLLEAGLSPIQHWFFQTFRSHTAHWNQSVCLRVAPHLDYHSLTTALRQLLGHHGILRVSFPRTDSGRRQLIRDVEDPLPVTHLDLSACPEQDVRTRLEFEADRINREMDLEQGRLVKLIFALTPDGQQNYLVMAIHHLVVDAESWRTLLADLESLWSATARGEAMELPSSESTFLQWCSRLQGYADSAEIAAELPYWQRLEKVEARPLPLDREAGPDANSNGSLDVVTVSLRAEETEALLRSVSRTYRTEITEVLLSGLLFATNSWGEGDSLLVDVEGHGREHLFDDLDISRSVGWFTSLYSVFLSAGEAGQASELLLQVKEILRQVPRRGIGYGIARYLRALPEGNPPLSAQAQVCFNYLGQVDRLKALSGDLAMESDQFGESRHPRGQRAYQLEINARIVGGQLQIDCIYSLDLHKRQTIEGFARDYLSYLRELVAESAHSESVVFSPSDFPLADLDREDMDAIAGLLSDVDDDPE